MKLKELKSKIDAACEYAGDCDVRVEIWHNDKEYKIERIGQFEIVPNVTIMIAEKINSREK